MTTLSTANGVSLINAFPLSASCSPGFSLSPSVSSHARPLESRLQDGGQVARPLHCCYPFHSRHFLVGLSRTLRVFEWSQLRLVGVPFEHGALVSSAVGITFTVQNDSCGFERARSLEFERGGVGRTHSVVRARTIWESPAPGERHLRRRRRRSQSEGYLGRGRWRVEPASVSRGGPRWRCTRRGQRR